MQKQCAGIEWPLTREMRAHKTISASLYNNGLGVPTDYVEAMRWYQMAAKQGDMIAQGNIGVFYDHGLGVSVNYAEAKRWYQMACRPRGCRRAI